MDRVWLQIFKSSSWNISSFQIIAGMLSAPKALEDLRFLVADLSSEIKKRGSVNWKSVRYWNTREISVFRYFSTLTKKIFEMIRPIF